MEATQSQIRQVTTLPEERDSTEPMCSNDTTTARNGRDSSHPRCPQHDLNEDV
ncbi:hypothetical protein M422DRAFT_276992 [Sphaerobolus stellatus SS14]|uniref:Uncharacterized protein n=1 Tax=Sphaerobolus stellatus (strain SS14) TaxID=990650 RepID=A0A0C9TL13_SPHS4|nr:hypothetical protein M422DRAFT_276992 [Sphaerobolus stellatus SS14]